jgi:hypothetical protein
MPLHRQMSEELLHLGGVHVARMAFVVEEDETSHPLEVTFLGAQGMVTDAQGLTGLVEQAGRPGQRHLAEVGVPHHVVEEVEGVAAGGEGPDRSLSVWATDSKNGPTSGRPNWRG